MQLMRKCELLTSTNVLTDQELSTVKRQLCTPYGGRPVLAQ